MAKFQLDAYLDCEADVREAAANLRAFNELVQAILWILLGFAEGSDHDFFPLPVDHPRVGAEHTRRHLVAHITCSGTEATRLPQMGSPFIVSGRGPLDGLYLCHGVAMRAIGTPWQLTDLTGLKFSELERASATGSSGKP
jgi:hypothetical protein